jgi:ubiquinone/menaquinone biosynthesis C-methylase UbiE
MLEDRIRKVKELTSRMYESHFMNDALGDTFRPGGLNLTVRLAELAGLNSDSFVLDIACGKGATPCFLSHKYGCRVVGIDLSTKLVSIAQKKSENDALLSHVDLLVGDGEKLPFNDSTFDIVISECSISLLPDKRAAAKEIRRVMKPKGKLVISDVILRSKISSRLNNQIAFASCVSGAESLNGYIKLFENVGFGDTFVEDHSEEMKRMAYQILVRFGSFETFSKKLAEDSGIFETGCCGKRHGSPWLELFKEGKPGYALLSFTKLR